MSRAVLLAQASLFTAFTAAATMLFTVYVPATQGFFNLGETMVYVAALVLPPSAAAFAGGVGSMLADILLGYPVFAPATLVIKACEGWLVASLSRKKPNISSKMTKVLSLSLIGVLFACVLALGTLIYSGEVELTMGPPMGQVTLLLQVPWYAWLPIGVLAVAAPSYYSIKTRGAEGWQILSIVCGGLVMIAGYFVYEQFFLGYYALAEVPANIGQVAVGASVALPTYKAVRKVVR